MEITYTVKLHMYPKAYFFFFFSFRVVRKQESL